MAELPTKEELVQLPLRATVAYAARCARRVSPLVERAKMHFTAKIEVGRAIVVAEGFALGRRATADDIAKAATEAAAAIAVADADAACHAACHAAYYAARAAKAAAAADAAVTADAAAAAADAAAVAAAAVAAVDAARADFDRLILLHLGPLGEVGFPIDPSGSGPLGPLWPGGEPVWPQRHRVVRTFSKVLGWFRPREKGRPSAQDGPMGDEASPGRGTV
jgi:hypothetical protein